MTTVIATNGMMILSFTVWMKRRALTNWLLPWKQAMTWPLRPLSHDNVVKKASGRTNFCQKETDQRNGCWVLGFCFRNKEESGPVMILILNICFLFCIVTSMTWDFPTNCSQLVVLLDGARIQLFRNQKRKGWLQNWPPPVKLKQTNAWTCTWSVCFCLEHTSLIEPQLTWAFYALSNRTFRRCAVPLQSWVISRLSADDTKERRGKLFDRFVSFHFNSVKWMLHFAPFRTSSLLHGRDDNVLTGGSPAGQQSLLASSSGAPQNCTVV